MVTFPLADALDAHALFLANVLNGIRALSDYAAGQACKLDCSMYRECLLPHTNYTSLTQRLKGAIISSVIGLLVVGQFHINAITTRQTLKHPTIVAVKGIQSAIPAQPVAVDSCQSA